MNHVKQRLGWGLLAAAAACTLLAAGATASVVPHRGAPEHAPSAAAAGARPDSDNWAMYHYDQERQGYDPGASTASGQLSSAWQTNLDGAVYAEPLVVNDEVIAVTENDTLYALSLQGDVLWSLHVGDPVPVSELPCGNIDPLGITGTPIYSADTGDVYFAAELDHPIRHELFAVDLATGQVVWSRPLDPDTMRRKYQQQRAALAIAQGRVWVSFGGLAGDCGPYHGWVIGYALDGSGDPSVYQTPSRKQAGIWGPSGPAVGVNGNLYVADGNGAAVKPPFDYGNSVIELDNASPVNFFAPKRWAHLNAQDLDIGTIGPLLFNAFGEDWVFQNGKSGTGYLLRQDDLGGIGGQVTSVKGCRAWGADAIHDDVIYVSCHDFLVAYQVLPGPTLTQLWTNRDAGYGSGPVVGGGAVWAAFQSRLWQIDPMTGKSVANASTGAILPHFATPTLHGSLVIVGTMTGVTAISTG